MNEAWNVHHPWPATAIQAHSPAHTAPPSSLHVRLGAAPALWHRNPSPDSPDLGHKPFHIKDANKELVQALPFKPRHLNI